LVATSATRGQSSRTTTQAINVPMIGLPQTN
jgi:hypothetical protein